MSSRVVLLAVLAIAGCKGSKRVPTDSATGSAVAAIEATAANADPDTLAMCVDLDQLVTAAATNFAELRTELPALRGRHEGVTATHTIHGAQQCAIVHADPDDVEDTMECDLADSSSLEDARAVLAAWEPRIAGCMVVQDWFSKTKGTGPRTWERETKGDHLLMVKLHLAGEDPSVRPVLRISRPEL